MVAQDGRYQVEWWDPRQGGVTRTETLESQDRTLAIAIAPLARDVACKITTAK